MTLLDASGDPIRRRVVASPRPQSAFLRGLQEPLLWSWNVALREPADEYRRAWIDVTTRTIDALHNSGWLAGGVTQATAAICGPFMALNAKPDPSLFGGEKEAADWARQVERRFEVWARSPYACDLMMRQNLGQMCKQGVKGYFGTGEICGMVRYVKRPGQAHGTKIQMLPSTRIPQAAQWQNPPSVQGVVLDRDGAPRAYWFKTVDPIMMMEGEERLVMARDRFGRPVVIHIHDSPPTVVRGISPLAPALQIVRQFDQLSNATLTAALLQAIFAATLESDLPTNPDLLQLFQSEEEQAIGSQPTGVTGEFNSFIAAKAEWYKSLPFNIDMTKHGKVLTPFPGEHLEFLGSKHPNAEFKWYARFLLLEVARCLGITYEQLTGDREGATYSSERMGSAENHLIVLDKRQGMAGSFMQIAYEAWLEEDIELGFTQVPGGLPAFLANRDAFCRADWRGPPKPTADELKAAKAMQIKLNEHIITREVACADEGLDWQDVDDQRARERDNAEALGLDPDPVQSASPLGGGGDVSGYDPDDADTPAGKRNQSLFVRLSRIEKAIVEIAEHLEAA